MGVLEPFDIARALQQHGHDPVALCDVADLFVDTSPGLMTDLRVALAETDLDRVFVLAGRLKTKLGELCAYGARNAAEELERAADVGRPSDAQRCFALLVRQVDALVPVLRTLLIDPVRPSTT